MKWEKVLTLVLLGVIAAAATVIAVRESDEGRYNLIDRWLVDRKTGAVWRWQNVGDLDGDRENDWGWQRTPKDVAGTMYTKVTFDPEPVRVRLPFRPEDE